MRLAVVADVHCGNFARHAGPTVAGLNARCRLTLDTLRRAVELANEREAILAVAGDLFHTKRPEPAVIAGVQRVLDECAEKDPLLLLGNHDAIGPGDHALAPLATNLAEVCAEVRYFPRLKTLAVPWSPEPALARLDAALAAVKCSAIADGILGLHLLLLHCGLYDQTFPDYLAGPGAIRIQALWTCMANFDAPLKLVLAGDYHKHRVWMSGACPDCAKQVPGGCANPDGVCVSDCACHAYAVQVGCLNPTGHSDAGTEGYGSVILADTETGAWERVELPGPRFLTFKYGSADLALLAKLREQGNTVFARIACAPGEEPAAEEEARMVREHAAACDVEPAESGAEVAPEQEPVPMDFDEALREYVGRMDLPAGVAGDDVLARARGYVKP